MIIKRGHPVIPNGGSCKRSETLRVFSLALYQSNELFLVPLCEGLG